MHIQQIGWSRRLILPCLTRALMNHLQMRKVGEKIVQHARMVSLGAVTWAKFPDGFPNIFVHNVELLKVSHTLSAPQAVFVSATDAPPLDICPVSSIMQLFLPLCGSPSLCPCLQAQSVLIPRCVCLNMCQFLL